jgi:hypothetical protein
MPDPWAELARLPDHLAEVFRAIYFDKWISTDDVFLRVYKRRARKNSEKKPLRGQLEDLERRGLVESERFANSGNYQWRASL